MEREVKHIDQDQTSFAQTIESSNIARSIKRFLDFPPNCIGSGGIIRELELELLEDVLKETTTPEELEQINTHEKINQIIDKLILCFENLIKQPKEPNVTYDDVDCVYRSINDIGYAIEKLDQSPDITSEETFELLAILKEKIYSAKMKLKRLMSDF